MKAENVPGRNHLAIPKNFAFGTCSLSGIQTQGEWSLTWSQIPENRFPGDVAHIVFGIYLLVLSLQSTRGSLTIMATSAAAVNNGAGQTTAQMCKLICAFVVHIWINRFSPDRAQLYRLISVYITGFLFNRISLYNYMSVNGLETIINQYHSYSALIFIGLI